MPTNRQVGRPLITDFQDEEFTLGILRNPGIPRNSSGMSRGLLGIPDLRAGAGPTAAGPTAQATGRRAGVLTFCFDLPHLVAGVKKKIPVVD